MPLGWSCTNKSFLRALFYPTSLRRAVWGSWVVRGCGVVGLLSCGVAVWGSWVARRRWGRSSKKWLGSRRCPSCTLSPKVFRRFALEKAPTDLKFRRGLKFRRVAPSFEVSTSRMKSRPSVTNRVSITSLVNSASDGGPEQWPYALAESMAIGIAKQRMAARIPPTGGWDKIFSWLEGTMLEERREIMGEPVEGRRLTFVEKLPLSDADGGTGTGLQGSGLRAGFRVRRAWRDFGQGYDAHDDTFL